MKPASAILPCAFLSLMICGSHLRAQTGGERAQGINEPFIGSQVQRLSGEEHAKDIIEAFYGDAREQPKILQLAKSVSSTIDSRKAIDKLNALYEQNGLKKIGAGQHRVYGHWGFSGSIPKASLDAIYSSIDNSALSDAQKAALRQQAKKIVVEQWTKDVTEIKNQVARLFPGLSDRQIRGVAGLFYDIHILGDMTTSAGMNSTMLGGAASLQSIAGIKADIAKNLHRILGGNSDEARRIIEKLDPLFKDLEEAKRINDVAAIKEIKNKIKQELAKNDKVKKNLEKGKKAAEKANVGEAEPSAPPSYSMNWSQAATMGVSMAVFRNFGSIKNTVVGEEEWQNSLTAVGRDAVGYTASIKLANAIIVQAGDKIAILSWLPKTAHNTGGAVIAGMFIFDSAKVGFSYLQGNISEDEFIEEFVDSSKQTLKAAISATIALAVVPGGQPMVVAIILTTGVTIAFDTGVNYAMSHMNYGDLTIEEIERFFGVSFDGYFTSFNPPKYENIWGNDQKHDVWGREKYPTSFDLPKYETHWP
jgi:hypothetical protein